MKKLLIILSLSAFMLNAQNWQYSDAMTEPVSDAVATVSAKTFYVFGGFSESEQGPVTWIQRYLFNPSHWKKVSDCVEPREGLTGAKIDTVFYFFGGIKDTSSRKKYLEGKVIVSGGNATLVDSSEIFDRLYAQAVSYNRKLYVIGGNEMIEDTTADSYIASYNIDNGEIIKSSAGSQFESDLPELQMVARADSIVYIFGGYYNVITTDIYKYNLNSDELTLLDAQLTVPRAGGIAEYYAEQNKIYIVGGFNGTSNALGSVEVFDVATETSSERPELTLNDARSRFAGGIVDNVFFIVGGLDENGAHLNSTEELDLDNITSVDEKVEINSFSLGNNYPNPFNPVTKINYSLDIPERVKLEVYTIQGEKLNTLVDEFQHSGEYSIEFNAGSNIFSSGVYFYRLTVGEKSLTEKMVLLK